MRVRLSGVCRTDLELLHGYYGFSGVPGHEFVGGVVTAGSRYAAQPAYTCRMATIDISRLSPEERLRLLEQLWESLSATPEAIPLTNAQREELDRRLNELDRDGPVGIPWEEVLHRIRSHAL